MFTTYRMNSRGRAGRLSARGLSVELLEAKRLLAGDGEPELVRFESAGQLETFLLEDSLARWGGLFGQPAWSGRWFGLGPEGDVLRMTDLDDSLAAPPEQPDHSETNIQVAGVDEDDIVETDGNYLYLLSSQELVIADAWQPSEMQVLSRVALDSQPIGEFLRNDRLTIISTVQDQWVGGPPIDMIAVDAIAPFYEWTPPRTKVTVLDVSDRAHPSIVQQTELDGWYVESRAIGDFVYTITSDQFGLPEPMIKCDESAADFAPPDGDARLPVFFDGSCTYETQEEYLQRVSGHILELGVPQYSSYDAQGQVVESGMITQPTDMYKPITPDHWNLLTVAVFNTASNEPGPVSSTSVPTTYATTVYGSVDSLYLTNPEWRTETQGEATSILKFDLVENGARVDLSAVGYVPGRVLNAFSIDEYDDGQGTEWLRIATTSGWGNTSDNRVFVLQQNGDQLETVGKTPQLAAGEQIFSVRFVDQTAFVVTFRQVDPLFAIDLSVPTDPQVMGDLHIPGFSNYLQPVRDDFLVGLGRNADPNTGRVQQLQVSLFDVADLSKPSLADRYTFTVPDWAWSEALSDHHAISYFPEYQVLTLPITNDGWVWLDSDGDGGADFQSYRPRTDLYVFQLELPEVGNEQRAASFRFLGTIEDDAAVRRSVRIEDFLYSISNNSVTVHPILDPKTLVAELHFGQEDVGVPVFEADRESDVVRAAIDTPELVPPQVIDVFVGGTQWDGDVVNYLEAEGMAALADDPLAVLPFAGADQIKVKFSEDVLVGQNALTLVSQNRITYGFRDFTYDADTATATWTLASPIGADKVTIRLGAIRNSVTDTARHSLDGDANGTVGGTFRAEYRVLPGDVDGDGRVDGADLALATRHMDAVLGDDGYSLAQDLDGNGRIDANDLAAIQQRAGTTLPGYIAPIAGDANGDGIFNSSDLVQVLQLGRYRTGEFASWQEGDWNRDGLFDEGDLIFAFQEGHYADAAAAIDAVLALT